MVDEVVASPFRAAVFLDELLQLHKTLVLMNQHLLALTGAVEQMAALQKEINRDAMTANIRLQEVQAFLKMPPYDRG